MQLSHLFCSKGCPLTLQCLFLYLFFFYCCVRILSVPFSLVPLSQALPLRFICNTPSTLHTCSTHLSSFLHLFSQAHSAPGLVNFMIHGHIVPSLLQRRSWSNSDTSISIGKKENHLLTGLTLYNLI